MNPLEKLKLPKKKTVKMDMLEQYRRGGKTDALVSTKRLSSIPVTLDPYVMQSVLQEAVMAEHKKMMTKQQDDFLMQLEQSRLPPADPSAIMPEK